MWSRFKRSAGRLFNVFAKRRPVSELDEELQFHLEMETAANRTRGLDEEQARRVALSQLHLTQTREAVQLARAGFWRRTFDSLRQDLLYSVRTLRRSPAFTCTAVLVLALGIGINSAVFSVINAVFFKPLPVGTPEELAYVYRLGTFNGIPDYPTVTSYQDLEDFDDHYDTVFSAMTAHWSYPAVFVADGEGQRLWGELVAANYFDFLGLTPARGRFFRPDEDEVSNPSRAVVISDELWMRRFHRDPSVIGKQVRLNEKFYSVIGVAGPEFKGVTNPWTQSHYWITATQFSDDRPYCNRRGGCIGLGVIARLKPGVSLGQARPVLAAQAALVDSERMRPYRATLPSTWKPARYVVFPAADVRTPFDPMAQLVPMRLASAVAVVVGIVLLIAAANIAGVLLARGVARTNELAVRQALGAGTIRLIRQLITESVVLSTIAGAMGLALAWFLVNIYRLFTPARFAVDAPLDVRILLFTAVVSIAAGVLVGLVPAFQVLRVNVLAALGAGAGYGLTRRVRGRLRHGVVIPQVALAMALLVVAGVHVRSLVGVEQHDVGYNMKDVTVFSVGHWDPADRWQLPYSPEAAEARARRAQEFIRRVSDRLAAVPVAGGMALTSRLPVYGTSEPNTFVSQDAYLAGNPTPTGASRADVTNGYFRTMGISLRQGRDFDGRDSLTSPRVAIVSEALARRLWPAGTALGRQLAAYVPNKPDQKIDWLEVVGVVGEVDPVLHEVGQQPFVYMPYSQRWEPYGIQVVARQPGDVTVLIKNIKTAVVGTDAFAEVSSVQTMEQIAGEILYPRRAAAGVLVVSGTVGLLLAAIGLYGVVAYSVAQRLREIGIRATLGADRRDIMTLVLREGAAVATIGAIPGFGASLLALRWTSTLVGTLPTIDVTTFVLVPIVMAAVVLLACYLPARRAARVDPMAVLRAQ